MLIHTKSKDFYSSSKAIILYLVLFKILFHLIHPEYGYFRDELFYIAVSDQLSIFNLDLPPLTPFILKIFTSIFGYNIKSLHLASGLCGALVIYVSCEMTRILGGKQYAVFFTGILVFFSGILPFGALYSYDSFNFLIETTAIFLLLKLIIKENPLLWIFFGITLGLGFLNKMSILLFGFSLFISLLISSERKFFLKPWIWISSLIAFSFSIPFLIWQANHHWYFLDFVSNYAGGLSYDASIWEFLWSITYINNIFSLPFWFTGLYLLLFNQKWGKYRIFGIWFIIKFILDFYLGVKFYFIFSMLMILFAVGAIKMENIIEKLKNRKRVYIKFLLPVIYIILYLPTLPMTIPILPVSKLINYLSIIGVDAGVKYANIKTTNLPPHISDRFGWEEMVKQTYEIYSKLMLSSNEDIGILVDNYGQGGAINLFGRKYHLPKPAGFNDWYYYETLKSHVFKENYLAIGIDSLHLKYIFENVIDCGIYEHPYCISFENHKHFHYCSKPRFNLKSYWQVFHKMDKNFLKLIKIDFQEALLYFNKHHRDHPDILLFNELQIRHLGYQYLEEGETEKAIILFEMNAQMFPFSWSVYYHLAEAYRNNKKDDLALKNYQRAIEINKNNEEIKTKIKQILQSNI